MSVTDESARSVDETLTEDVFVERAIALIPTLEARQEETLVARVVPAETIQDLKDAGLFKILQPPRWGGYDVPYATVARTVEELAKGCPSSAWVYGVLGLHNGFMSGYSEQAQEEVWGDDSEVLICSSYAPKLGQDVDGGIRLSAMWGFSSGCDHSGWALLGAVTPERGVQGALVPLSEIEIIDDWEVLGLEGTGSKSLQLDDVFVPDHRLMPFDQIHAPRKSDRYPDSFWDNQLLGLFGTYNFSFVAAGIARKALELGIELFREPDHFGVPRGAQETLQMRLSEAAADIEMTADAMLERCRYFDRKWETRTPITVADHHRHRRDMCVMVWRLRHAVEKLTSLHNSWVYDNSPLQSLLRDIVVASAHRAAHPEDNMLPWAKDLLEPTA